MSAQDEIERSLKNRVNAYLRGHDSFDNAHVVESEVADSAHAFELTEIEQEILLTKAQEELRLAQAEVERLEKKVARMRQNK